MLLLFYHVLLLLTELKALPSLRKVELGMSSFCNCKQVRIENLRNLESITLGNSALKAANKATVIMKGIHFGGW